LSEAGQNKAATTTMIGLGGGWVGWVVGWLGSWVTYRLGGGTEESQQRRNQLKSRP